MVKKYNNKLTAEKFEMESRRHPSPKTPGFLPDGTLCIFQESN